MIIKTENVSYLKTKISSEAVRSILEFGNEYKKLDLPGMYISDFSCNVLLAGSFSTNLISDTDFEFSDYDLFLLNEDVLEKLDSILVDFGYKCIKTTQYAKTWRHDVLHTKHIQTIPAYGKTPEQVLETFDINVCMAGFDGQNVYSLDQIGQILDNKVIGLNGKIPNPRHTLQRLLKYQKRGFDVSKAVDSLYSIIASRAKDGSLAESDYIDYQDLFPPF